MPKELDSTTESVRHHLDALGARAYEVGLRARVTGALLIKGPWSGVRVLAAIPNLQGSNDHGHDIYIRPAPLGGLVLIEALSAEGLAALCADRLDPAAVVESGPSCFQAWVRIAPCPIPIRVVSAIAEHLTSRYGKAHAGANQQQFGLLAGFHHQPWGQAPAAGQAPVVRVCRVRSGVAPKGFRLVMRINAELERQDRQLADHA